MKNPFTPAKELNKRVKMLVYGESGAGKTTLGLQLGEYVDGKVAMIDLEGGADWYAKADNLPDFDVLRTASYQQVLDALRFIHAKKHEYGLLIIDPITVVWDVLQGGMQIKRGEKPINIADWGRLKREMKAVYDLIASLPIHVYVTARQKEQYRGDTVVGYSPDAEKNLPYMFDVVMRLEGGKNGTRAADVVKVRNNALPPNIPELTAASLAPLFATSAKTDDHTYVSELDAAKEFADKLAQDDPATQSRSNGDDRPYDPSSLRRKFGEWVAKQPVSDPTENPDALVASVSELAGGDENAYRFLLWLTKQDDVTAITKAQASMISRMVGKPDHARTEITSVLAMLDAQEKEAA